MGERRFECVGDGHYRLTDATYGIQIDVDRLRRDRHELMGELSVACDIAGARTIDGCLSIADWNVSSAESRNRRAKLLAERSEAPDLDWLSYLEELAQRTIRAEREGSGGAKNVMDFPKPSADADFLVEGWPLLRDHPVIAFGDGGAAKSYLALFAAGELAKQGARVLYADWELSGSDHRDRFERLFGAAPPHVDYLRCDRPLLLEADRISREIHRHGIDYWIADSIGFATGGPPEAAEHALAYFRVVRQLGIGSLHLAHINRSEQGSEKPFGSAFYHNSARATWLIKRSEEETTSHQKFQVGVFNKKCNVRARHHALAFELDFLPTTTTIHACAAAGVRDFAREVPLWQRVTQCLKAAGRALTIDEIAEELQAKRDSIQRITSPSRGGRYYQPVTGADGVARIGLKETRFSAPSRPQ